MELAAHLDVFLITLLGLLVGSFLNVVIHRLPLMMAREERAYAWAVLHEDADPADNPHMGKRFNLLVPPSHCPHCETPIRAWQNIPLWSYLRQRGRCRHCQQPYSSRYFWVELLCGLLSLLVALRFSEALPLAGALMFSWALLALFFIDAEEQLLPDVITLPLLWLGLALALQRVYVPLPTAVLGAMVGYALLWLVFWLFKLITGREGMGYGDFKLLAALLAWNGLEALPFILSGAAVLGLLVGLLRQVGFGRPMAFGPFLIGAGWIYFMYAPPGGWLL